MTPAELEQIVEAKRDEIAASELHMPPELILECLEPSYRDFRAAIADGRKDSSPRTIALVQRDAECDFVDMLESVQESSTACIVPTDRDLYKGSLEDLDAADLRSTIPLVRRDIIVDSYQIIESRQFGADAIILLASILTADEIKVLSHSAQEWGIDVIVEVSTADELARAIEAEADIICISADADQPDELIAGIPEGTLIIAEAKDGVDAVITKMS